MVTESDKDMKVIIITQGISRIVMPLLNSDFNIVGIIESAPRPKKSKVYSLYRSAKGFIGNLARLSKKRGIPYYYLQGKVDSTVIDWVKQQDPDLMVVFSMSQLLPESLFNLPKYGTINLHPSYLPEYRGALPDYWQYRNMEMNPGATVHYIDKGEDTGSILEQERVQIELGISSPDWLDRVVGEVGVKLLLKAMTDIANGTATATAQPTESPTPKARKLDKAEHREQIDWKNWDVDRVWHILRGTQIWLNAIEQPTGLKKGQRWSIGKFIEVDTSDYEVSKVTKINGYDVLICRNGLIYLSVDFSFKSFIKSWVI
ncbi:formyltransferase family protein [Vibrio vulnificus]|uniref:methionyl-tRNA formyltransferase n=1 Tax=Vibrio vulnificus TaxID=672 RepID=UPI004058DF8B